ncbi:MAG: hypothetical protein KAH15_02065 [Candidatus Marinimicrobia bacterium]|nr:hypothetical protein [Candidatus Neomarinimicrobiota bacterium]
MKNNTRIMLNMILMIAAIVLIIMGVTSEIYLISVAGILIFLATLIMRGTHIRKMNQELKELKEVDQDEIDDNQI